MTEENKVVVPPTEGNKKSETIDVEFDGVSVNVDLETGKKLIEIRQKYKKELISAKEHVAKVDAESKSTSQKAALLEAMKASDIDSVKAQVSAEYLDKIAKYENKIFNSEIKSLLASEGTLPGALDDAANLALQGAKVELKDGKVVIGDKPADEYVKEFIKSRPHLLAVKATAGRKETPSTPPKDSGFNKFAADLFTKPQGK